MKNRIRMGMAALALATVSVYSSATPVHATHQWDRGYWTRAPHVAWDGVASANIQDGAYYWQDRGFSYGYVPPLPGYDHGGTQCTAVWDGYINVCTVSQSIAEAYGGAGTDGVNDNYIFSDGSISAAWILVGSHLGAADRQRVWRHEFGHAIGLGHWNPDNCVMDEFTENQPLGETCDHDWDALDEMYA